MQGKNLVQAALLAQNEVDSRNKQLKLRQRNFAKTFCELNFIQRDPVRPEPTGSAGRPTRLRLEKSPLTTPQDPTACGSDKPLTLMFDFGESGVHGLRPLQECDRRRIPSVRH
jgi:hypothetical protein